MSGYNPYSLEGKTVLVTGASSGIGQATAIECSRMGAYVIITGRNQERLEQTLSLMDTTSSQRHSLIVADLTKEDDLQLIVESIESIDGLVNNAGVNRIKPVAFVKNDDLEYIFQNNAFTGVNLTRALLKKKRISKGGSIVFTSSISAFYNAPGRLLYSGSKAALTSFMRSFAVELADKHIRVNAVHPGMVETNMTAEHISNDEQKRNLGDYPLKRYGKPEEIAWAMIYLLSDAAAWVTGSSLTIDGGFMLK